MASLTDVYSTLEDLTDQPRKALGGEDGFNLLPALDRGATSGRDTLINHSINGTLAIRRGAWKLCFSSGSGGWSAPTDEVATEKGLPSMQLFLEEDPEEQNNLVSDHPEIVAALSILLDREIRNGRCTPGDVVPNDRDIQFLPEGNTLVNHEN